VPALTRPAPRLPVLGLLWAGTATLAAPILRRLLRRRAGRGKENPARLAEREGIDATPRPAGPLLWMHAASVGETISILPVLTVLTSRSPDLHILMTTGTLTSGALLAERLPAMGLSDRVSHRFAPLDVPAWVRRFLDHWRPDAACFVETELWPNQLHACRKRGIPLFLLNGRLSEGSTIGWRRAPGFARYLLQSFQHVQARTPLDAERFRSLGACRVDNPGDLKLAAPDLPADQDELDRLRRVLGDRPVWLAASTHPGEEALIATVHRRLVLEQPGLLTLIVPRHPDRGASIAAELGAPRRSAGEDPPAGGGLWIADTLGELGLWFRLASVVFVGRSLIAPGGGQNPLEPARLGCAMAVGPYTGNFIDHVAMLREAGGLEEVADVDGLTRFVADMLGDATVREAMADRAAEVARAHGGLPDLTAGRLLDLLRRD